MTSIENWLNSPQHLPKEKIKFSFVLKSFLFLKLGKTDYFYAQSFEFTHLSYREHLNELWQHKLMSTTQIDLRKKGTWGLLNKLFGMLQSRRRPSIVMLEASSCRQKNMTVLLQTLTTNKQSEHNLKLPNISDKNAFDRNEHKLTENNRN